jgi:hypothetical protein
LWRWRWKSHRLDLPKEVADGEPGEEVMRRCASTSTALSLCGRSQRSRRGVQPTAQVRACGDGVRVRRGAWGGVRWRRIAACGSGGSGVRWEQRWTIGLVCVKLIRARLCGKFKKVEIFDR